MSYDVGDVWTPTLTVQNAAGTPTDAVVTLTVTSPSGAFTSPTPTTTGTGEYAATVPLTATGQWTATWAVSGAVTGSETQYVDVRSGMAVLPLQVLRARVGADESEDDLLLSLRDVAVSHIERYIGSPIRRRTVTVTLQAGSTLLPDTHVASLVSVADSNGTALDGYLVSGSGVLTRPGWYWSGPVTVTYVAGFAEVPPELLEAVVYTVQHAYESQNGAVPTGYGGADETFTVSRGFYLPNRAKELLAPYRSVVGIA